MGINFDFGLADKKFDSISPILAMDATFHKRTLPA